MREIKFRAFQDGGMLTQPISSIYGLTRFMGLLYEDTKLMQYTGLTDKNGAEIYEGDIVKKDDTQFPEYHGATGQVIYETLPYRMAFDINLIKGDAWSFYYPDGSNWCNNQIQVIGNIYENPELLTGA